METIVEKFNIRVPTNGMKVNKHTYKAKCLSFVTNDEAVEQALNTIDKERAGEQLGLYGPWPKINRMQGKYFRFAQVNVFFSKTGHGKSYTMLQLMNSWSEFIDKRIVLRKVSPIEMRNEEFEATFETENVEPRVSLVRTSKYYYKKIEAINKKFVEDGNKVIFLNFYFEMRGEDDVTRNLSILSGKSVATLYSSEFNLETDNYNNISEQEFKAIKYLAGTLKGRPIYYFEVSGSMNQIYNTFKYWKHANPDCEFVVNIDHAGLIDEEEYQSELDVMKQLAKLAIRMRNERAMVNIVMQMNSNILDGSRQNKPSGQHPVITDIHGSNQVGWAVDNAWCIPWRPEVEHFAKYGVNQMTTKDLVVACKLKSRNGYIGETYFQNRLDKGLFIPLTLDEVKQRITVKAKPTKKNVNKTEKK